MQSQISILTRTMVNLDIILSSIPDITPEQSQILTETLHICSQIRARILQDLLEYQPMEEDDVPVTTTSLDRYLHRYG